MASKLCYVFWPRLDMERALGKPQRVLSRLKYMVVGSFLFIFL